MIQSVLLSLAFSSALLAATTATTGEAEPSWPCFFGPDHDGVSQETGWSSAGKEKPVWTRQLGLGYSNVALHGGRLFTLGFDEGEGVDRAYCLDAETGAEIWTREWPAEILANFHGGGTLTTPSVDGDTVFISTRHGLFFALDAATGATRIERDYREELKLELSFHGFSASPLVLSDRVILMLGGTVCAIDKTSGDVIWKTIDHGDGGYSNPVPFERDNRMEIAAFLGSGLFVIDADTGHERYHFPWKSNGGGVNACSPIIVGDRVFISTAYNLGSAMIELGDEKTPAEIWRAPRMRNKVSSCVRWKDHIYGFDESMLKCIDMDGNELWYQRGLGMGSVALVGGRLIVLSSKGDLLIADASPDEFRAITKRKVLDDGVYWTTPVLLNGLLYCRNSLGSLTCLDHRGAPESTADPVATSSADDRVGLPEAESLFAGHAAAIGGGALAGRDSLRMEGTVAILGDGITETAMTLEQAAPDLWRLSYDLGKYGAVHHGYDGQVGWILDPFYGDRLMDELELRLLRETTLIHSPLAWRTTYEHVATRRQTLFRDRRCYEVEAKSTSGVDRRFYFDADTRELFAHDGDGEAMVVYENWRAFDGVRLPARITRILPDTGAEETYTIDEATWGVVSKAAFQRPEAVRDLLRTPEEIEAQDAAARTMYAAYLGVYSGEINQLPVEWSIDVEGGKLCAQSDKMGIRVLAEEEEGGGRFHFLRSKAHVLVFEEATAATAHAASFTFLRPEGPIEFTRR